MGRLFKRCLLGGLTGLLFLYLSLNLAVNASGLTHRLEKQVASTLGQPVKLGFVYLDWQGQPRLSYFAMWNEAEGEYGHPMVEINNLTIQPAWRAISNGNYDFDRLGFVRRVGFGHLAIRLDQIPKSEQLFRNLPPVPARASTWSIEYGHGEQSVLRVSGRRMRYNRNDTPVRLRVERLNDEPISARARLKFLPKLRWDFDVHEGSFPGGIWPLRDDRWEGTVEFDSVEEGVRFRADLEGTPGSLRDVQLPPVRLLSEINLGSDTTIVESIRMTSDYMNFDWGGTVARVDTGQRVDLAGSLFLNLKKLGNHFLRQRGMNRYRVDRAYPMNGSFRIEGGLRDPRVTGELDARSLRLELNRPDTNYHVEFRDWRARWMGDSMVLTSGRITERTNQFQLSSASVSLKRSRLMASLKGKLDALAAPLALRQTLKGSGMGSFQRAQGEISLTASLGRESTEMALALRGGTVAFERAQFQSVNFLSSFSSLKPIETRLQGRFSGPDQNEWVINGDHRRLRVRGGLRRVDNLLKLLPERIPHPGSLEMDGVRAMFQVEDPFRSIDRYFGFLKFDEALFRTGTGPPVLSDVYGEVTVSPGNVSFNGVYGRVGEGKFQVSGGYAADAPAEVPEWSVRVSGTELSLARLTPDGSPFQVSGGLDLNGTVSGPFRDPTFRTRLSGSKIDAYGISFRQFESRIRADGDSVSLETLQAMVGDGQITARGQLQYGRSFQLRSDMVGINLPETFDRVEFLRERSHGTLDANLRLGGDPTNRETWSGELDVRNEGVVLDRFPEIPGLDKIADESALNERIVVHDGQQTLPIRRGRIQFGGFKLTSDGMNLNGDGHLDLLGDLQMKLVLLLKEETLRGYLQHVLGDLYREVGLSDDPQEFKIPFYVRGTLRKPTVEIDHEEVSRRFRRKLVQDFIPEKLGGQMINELLQEIFD